jgi:hypothetical protein
MSFIKHFKLKAGDKLDWNSDIKDGKMVILVQPIKTKP